MARVSYSMAAVAQDDAVLDRVGAAVRSAHEVMDVEIPEVRRLSAIAAATAVTRDDGAAHLLPCRFLLGRPGPAHNHAPSVAHRSSPCRARDSAPLGFASLARH